MLMFNKASTQTHTHTYIYTWTQQTTFEYVSYDAQRACFFKHQRVAMQERSQCGGPINNINATQKKCNLLNAVAFSGPLSETKCLNALLNRKLKYNLLCALPT